MGFFDKINSLANAVTGDCAKVIVKVLLEKPCAQEVGA